MLLPDFISRTVRKVKRTWKMITSNSVDCCSNGAIFCFNGVSVLFKGLDSLVVGVGWNIWDEGSFGTNVREIVKIFGGFVTFVALSVLRDCRVSVSYFGVVTVTFLIINVGGCITGRDIVFLTEILKVVDSERSKLWIFSIASFNSFFSRGLSRIGLSDIVASTFRMTGVGTFWFFSVVFEWTLEEELEEGSCLR